MYHSLVLNVLIFTANAGWVVGTWAVGNKKRWGFALNFACEAVWLAYAALGNVLLGLGPWCIVGFYVFGRNWRKWKQGEREEADTRLERPPAP